MGSREQENDRERRRKDPNGCAVQVRPGKTARKPVCQIPHLEGN